ncbi:Asp23/Gls24 family envelope stress response protein [Streptococcus ruminantium]|uniref:Asp23/Gls24 family envelope stress response protein n=1 Tax=Streptococcus ruminantium TaxID=1917441 RepID=UPI0012DDBA3C|nr:Asp23/Gls24 family envelope stress response protein [Streptococcus ruminantium]
MTQAVKLTKAETIRGDLTYDDKVIEKIIGLALESVDGLLGVDGGFLSNIKEKLVNTDSTRDGVNVEVGKKQVAVDLNIVAEYKKHVPTIFEDIKKVIETEVKGMTNLDVVEVNVNVVDIKTRQQYEEEKISLQERITEVAQTTGEFASAHYNKAAKGIQNLTESDEPRVI